MKPARLRWQKNLDTAPRRPPANTAVLFFSKVTPGGNGRNATAGILEVTWVPHSTDVAQEIGRDGYWDYAEELVSGVTGGVPDDIAAAGYWTVISFPEPESRSEGPR